MKTSQIPEKALDTAVLAAEEAGRHMLKAMIISSEIEFKGATDLVTRFDRECQDIISSTIKKAFPNHSITGEEELDHKGSEEFLWLIDPIDGTTNFAHGLPMYCASIALLYRNEPVAGVVCAPALKQLFTAASGMGAKLNGKKISVSSTPDVSSSLLATGFPYDRRESDINNLNYFNSFILKCRGIRRMGSAALDLCYTAAGILDGYWELKLKPWDSAAGAVILQEAGGTISGFKGEKFDPQTTWCLASNGKIHKEMLSIISGVTPDM